MAEARGERLTVTIISARGLRNTDASRFTDDKSDPYCICSIPGKYDHEIRTRTIDNSLTPVWNHEAVMQDWEEGDDLIFTVYDKDFGKRDDALGSARLLGTEIRPKSGKPIELVLKGEGAGQRSLVKVQVAFGKTMVTAQSIKNAAMAHATYTMTGATSVKAKKRNERLGIENGGVGLTRHHFREFIKAEEARQTYCETLPLTLLLCGVFAAVAYLHGNVSSVHRIRRGMLGTLQDIRAPSFLPDGSRDDDTMLSNISSVGEMWDWLDEGLVRTVAGDENSWRPGFVNSFNKAIGRIQLRQRRRTVQACAASEGGMAQSLSEYTGLLCRALGEDPSADSFGPAAPTALAASDLEESEADSAFVAGGKLEPTGPAAYLVDSSNYYAFIDFASLEKASARVRELQANRWVDSSTEWAEAHLMLLNGEVRVFTHVIVRFLFLQGGVIEKSIEVRPLHLPEWTMTMIALDVIFGILLLALIFVPAQEISDTFKNAKTEEEEDEWGSEEAKKPKSRLRQALAAITEPWILLDIAGALIGLGLLSYFAVLLGFMDTLTEEMQKVATMEHDMPERPHANVTGEALTRYLTVSREYESELAIALDALRINVELKGTHRIAMFLYTFFIMLRLFRGFLGQPIMASIARTISSSAQEVIHFGFMLAVAFENFTLGGLLLFGAEVQDWSTVNLAHRSVLAMSTGNGDWASLYELYPISATVWLFSFAIVVVFIAMNLLLAILTDAYDEVKRTSSQSRTTIFHQLKELISDLVWTASYKMRNVMRAIRERWPKSRKWIPHMDPEEPRVTKIPFQEIIEILEKPLERLQDTKGSSFDFPTTQPSKDSVKSVPWARGMPDWIPFSTDILEELEIDGATISRLVEKCTAFPLLTPDFPTDALYHEFDGKMEALYEQIQATDADLDSWQEGLSRDIELLQPRNTKLERYASSSIMPRPDPSMPMILPASREDGPMAVSPSAQFLALGGPAEALSPLGRSR